MERLLPASCELLGGGPLEFVPLMRLSLLQTRAQGLSRHALSSDGHEASRSVLLSKGGASVEREETTTEGGNADLCADPQRRLPRRTAPLSCLRIQVEPKSSMNLLDVQNVS